MNPLKFSIRSLKAELYNMRYKAGLYFVRKKSQAYSSHNLAIALLFNGRRKNWSIIRQVFLLFFPSRGPVCK
jgi:hypothetical protein